MGDVEVEVDRPPGGPPLSAGEVARLREVVDNAFELGELAAVEYQVDGVVAHRTPSAHPSTPATDQDGLRDGAEDLIEHRPGLCGLLR